MWPVPTTASTLAFIGPVQEQVEVVEESTREIFERLTEDVDDQTKDIARAIIKAESGFVETAKNPDSSASGLFQITKATKEDFCPEADLLDAEDNINCGLKILEEEQYWRWSESADVWTENILPKHVPAQCSCIKTARNLGVDIPYNTNASDLESNANMWQGDLILLKYGDVNHAAIYRVTNDGFYIPKEGNKERCRYTERLVPFNDPSVIGFWSSPAEE